MADEIISKDLIRAAGMEARKEKKFGILISNLLIRLTRDNKTVTIIDLRKIFFDNIEHRWDGEWNDETQLYADIINKKLGHLFDGGRSGDIITKEAFREYRYNPRRKEYSDAPILEYSSELSSAAAAASSGMSKSAKSEVDSYMQELLREAREHDERKRREKAELRKRLVNPPGMMRQPSISEYPDAEERELFLGIFGEDEDARPEHSDELQRIVFDYRRELGRTKAEKESAAQRRAARKAKEIRYKKQGRSANSTRRARRGGHHLYKRLGVSKYASRKQIKNKYKKLKKSKKLTRKIREAYKVLSNKKSRKEYNNRYRKMKRKKKTRKRK